jgi:hypothetical protein
MSVKAELHALVDRLDDETASDALALIQEWLDERAPMHSIFDPPIDDEPETDEERALVAEADEALARGEGIPAADIFRRYGV